jgi:hypothetical protein
MTELENWLTQATRRLANDAKAQVRTEIREHYEAARDAALAKGATPADAERLAVIDLGDASIANCQYRRVLLTSAETRALRESKWESNAVCSRPWLKRIILAGHLGLLVAAAALFLTGPSAIAGDVLLCAIGMSPFTAAIFLPIDTPLRGFVFRCAKWITMTAAVLLLFGPHALKWSWLLISCLGPLAITEITRASIRRKLPIKAWPRHLYL